jgi:uncharacterized membrane protein HdeD (DUF308 family)
VGRTAEVLMMDPSHAWPVLLGLSVVAGVLRLAWPVPGVFALDWLIGLFALVYGFTLAALALALALRNATSSPAGDLRSVPAAP